MRAYKLHLLLHSQNGRLCTRIYLSIFRFGKISKVAQEDEGSFNFNKLMTQPNKASFLLVHPI